MKTFNNSEIKQLIDLELKWKRHKNKRGYTNCEDFKEFLTPIERERILDKVFYIMFQP